jgi:23S rRNA (adenine2503-C2)-methyltransferase
MGKPNLKDMTLEEIEGFMSDLGKEKYRAKQIMKWLYQSGTTSFDEMTNLSKDFRDGMNNIVRISTLEIVETQTSKDGTKKALFKLEGGNFIESVLIPGANHWTLCISTQVGCRMGCRFCLTGIYGLKRNLLPSEITDQITMLHFNAPDGENVKNIVMMGMGEPLKNYDNTLKAIRIMTTDCGLAISNRRITLSTCGIAPMVHKLGKDACVNLAISLNAPDDKTRNYLMPINKKYPLETFIKACLEYPMPRRRRITFEYILIEGVNSSGEDAEMLARLLRGVRCKLNLIPYNEYPGSVFRTPAEVDIEAFRKILIKHNYIAIIRASRGGDILAVCGQLSGQGVGE